MKFSRADVRDLVHSRDRFVATRLARSGHGFSDEYRRRLVTVLRPYYASGRDPDALFAALDGIAARDASDRQRQMSRTLRALLPHLVEWESAYGSDVAEPLLDERGVVRPWRNYDLAIPRDVVVSTTPRRIRYIWTDMESRPRRRGTTMLVAACLAHADEAIGADVERIDVWHLREATPRSWSRRDLEPLWDRLEAELRWASAALTRGKLRQ